MVVSQDLAAEAESLHAQARAHKSQERAHRKKARELMREYDRLRQVCSEHGITLIEGTDPGRSQPHARRNP